MAKCKKQQDIDLTASGDCCKCNGLDLISRQAAIDVIYRIVENNRKSQLIDDLAENPHVDLIIDILEDLPSAEPDIVYCKDCIHWVPFIACPHYCSLIDWVSSAYDYCSRAERRADE